MLLVFMTRGWLQCKHVCCVTVPSKRKQTSLHVVAVAMASSQQSMLSGAREKRGLQLDAFQPHGSNSTH